MRRRPACAPPGRTRHAVHAPRGLRAPAAAQPRSGGTLTIVQGEEPGAGLGRQHLDLHRDRLHQDPRRAARLRLRSPAAPGLAESWSVAPDGKTYTFRLRRGVTWHDGKPFTSADVKFSLEEIWKKLHPRGRITFSKVTAVDTPDASTVVVGSRSPRRCCWPRSAPTSRRCSRSTSTRARTSPPIPRSTRRSAPGRSSSRSGRRATSSAWRRTPTTGTRASRTSTPSSCGSSPTPPRAPPPSRRARCSSASSTRCRSPTSSA